MARLPRTSTPLVAYVLHRYDWSESSLILDLFTREQGRIAVAAKGAKRPYSQLRSVLLPFQRVHAVLGKAPTPKPDGEVSDVHTLRSAEFAGGAAMPQGAALFAGFYLNELLMRLLARHDPHPALFDAYVAALAHISQSAVDEDDAAQQAALRAFELMLLRELGHLPDLSTVSSTLAPVAPDTSYALRAEIGVAVQASDEPALSGLQLLHLQAALDHGLPAAVQHSCLPALPALKHQLRGLLHYHLGSNTLRTRQVMLDVQRLLGDTA